MPFVLDPSAALAWLLDDEIAPPGLTEAVAGGDVVVPAIWPFEMANALRNGERRGRYTAERIDALAEQVLNLAITIEDPAPEHVLRITMRLARTHRLSVYDATYLELALRRGLPLVTLDAELLAAATTVGLRGEP